jgi:hypothetical protein
MSSLYSQNNHVEGDDSLPMKTKLFFSRAAESWDAHFYVKVDDDVFVDIGKSYAGWLWLIQKDSQYSCASITSAFYMIIAADELPAPRPD